MALTAVQVPDLTVASSATDDDLIFLWRVAESGNARRATIKKSDLLTGLGGGGASVTVSGTAPSNPSAGDLWWDTSGNPDAGLKVRVGTAWQLSVSAARIVAILEAETGNNRLNATALRGIIDALNAETDLISLDRLGTGTKSVETCLRGDQSFGAINPVVVSVEDAEAGTSEARRTWTPQRVGQANRARLQETALPELTGRPDGRPRSPSNTATRTPGPTRSLGSSSRVAASARWSSSTCQTMTTITCAGSSPGR